MKEIGALCVALLVCITLSYGQSKKEIYQITAKQEVLKVYKQGLKKLNNFDMIFNDSDLEHKRQLIGSMFPEKFQFKENKVRTKDINPLLLKIASINKAYKRNKKRDKPINLDLSHKVHNIDLFSNHLLDLLKRLE